MVRKTRIKKQINEWRENMSERVKWIEHEGIQILFNDYTKFRSSDFIQYINESMKETLNSGRKIVYAINDVTDSYMDTESTNAAKTWVDKCKENGIELKIVLIGVTGLKKVIANAIMGGMYFATGMEDAKKKIYEWAIKDKQ